MPMLNEWMSTFTNHDDQLGQATRLAEIKFQILNPEFLLNRRTSEGLSIINN